MKRFVVMLVFLLILVKPAWGLACDVDATDTAVDFTVGGCTTFRIMENITLADAVTISTDTTEIYGKTGQEKISSAVVNDGLLVLDANNISVHGLQINNTGAGDSAAGIIVPNVTTGNSVYDVTFLDCGVNCVYLSGNGGANIYNDIFPTADDKVSSVGGIIKYVDAGQAQAAPTLVSGAFSTLDTWQMSLTAPAGTGDSELYVLSGNSLVPIGSISTDVSGNFTMNVNFSEQAPSGTSTFYALFTVTKTSAFSAALSINWANDTNFSWGSATACKGSTWFNDATQGYGAGDYDGDGKTNVLEDANADCVVDATETDSSNPDTDDDGYCDGSGTVAAGDHACTASDNCPLVANAQQKDLDGDGTGNLCDGDFSNSAPVIPELVSPADGATDQETTLTLSWNKTTDPEGDAITYQAYVCENSSFTGCTGYDVAIATDLSMNNLAKNISLIGGAFLVGSLFVRRRKKFLILLILGTGLLAYSCGGGSSTPVETNEISYNVSSLNLKSTTTYYWKVIATDANEMSTASATRSFVTK